MSEYQIAWDEAFANVENRAQEMADRIVEAFKSGDYKSIGSYISDNLEKALNGINWNSIYSGSKEFGSGFADFLNGLITPELFGSVGKTLAGALNTAVYNALAFGEEFDFNNFGESIATGINTFFETFDFGSLAEALNVWVDGLGDTIVSFVKELKWSDIIAKAGKFLGTLELDTVSVLIGAFAWKHGGAELTKNLFENLMGKAFGLTKMDGFWGTTLAVTIALDMMFETSNKEGAQEYKDSIDKFNSFEFGEMNLKDWMRVIQEFGLATVGLSGSMSSFNTLMGELERAMPKEEDYENIQEYTEALAAWQEQMEAMAMSKIKIPGLEYDEQEWWKSLGELKDKIASWWERDVVSAFDTGWNFVERWWSINVTLWWNNKVAPWFTVEKWGGIAMNIKEGIQGKWEDFSSWWGSNAVSKWWADKVVPWFSEKKWKFDGIKNGLKVSWETAIDSIKEVWNAFASWLNQKLTWTIDPVSVMGKQIFAGATINLGKIPTFYTGGFPEDGL